MKTKEPKKGEDLFEIAGRERVGKAHANCIIRNYNEWYEALRESYRTNTPQKAQHVSCSSIKHRVKPRKKRR